MHNKNWYKTNGAPVLTIVWPFCLKNVADACSIWENKYLWYISVATGKELGEEKQRF